MKSAKIDSPNTSPGPLNFYKHCFPKMPLGNKKNQDFSKVRGLLGRSERSLSLAAPKGMQLRLCDRSALSPAGSCPSGNVIREGASRFVSSAPPPPSPFWFFLSPVCTISLSPALQCVPIPLFCDWPSPRVYIISEALVESQWGLCNLCSSPKTHLYSLIKL